MPSQASKRKVMLKVILLGESGVGKTSLMNQFVNRQFVNQYKATVGADFLTKDISVDGVQVKMQVWDTAGQERFQSLGTAFYRGSDACILVYDITSSPSFRCLESWRDEFLVLSSPNDPEGFPFTVIGNKLDREADRVVTERKAKSWCAKHDIQYFEVSAKHSTNIEDAFIEVARSALARDAQDEHQTDIIEFPDQLDLGRGGRGSGSSGGRRGGGSCSC